MNQNKNPQQPEVANLQSPVQVKSKMMFFWGGVLILLIGIIALLTFIFKNESPKEEKKEVEIEQSIKPLDISRINKFVDEDEPIIIEPESKQTDNGNTNINKTPDVINDDFSKFNNVQDNTTKKIYIPKSDFSMVVATSNKKTNGLAEDEDFTQPSNQTVFKASFLKTDPTFLLSKGTFINCSLRTKLVSTIAGNLGCIITDDVYSSNGGVLLIEKGSTVFGSYKSGQLKNGQNRLFVIWEEIRTPNDITIPITSASTDSLGGAGAEGWVDNHWLERFGSSILLSTIEDTINALSDRLRKNSDNDYSQNTRDATEKMATKALDTMINIEPTLYKNHGDLIGIFVNKDIDFSSVYKLKRK